MYAKNSAIVLALAGLAAAQSSTSVVEQTGTVVTPAPVPQPTGSSNGTITITKVYDVYTTYCPGPTSFHLGGKDYVVTEPCTLTITDCPCTVVETSHPTWLPQPPPAGCPGGDHCVEHPGAPGKPAPGHPHAPGKPVAPEQPSGPEHPGKPAVPEHPGKPAVPETPEHPGKPVVPGTPDQSGKPGVPVCEGPHCPPAGETPKTGDETPKTGGETPKTGDDTKGQTPDCEGDDCPPVIVNGAGAVQLSLGLAAVLALFAL